MNTSKQSVSKVKTVASNTVKRGPGRPAGTKNKVKASNAGRKSVDSKLNEAVKLTESIIKNWDTNSGKVLEAHTKRAELLNDKSVAKRWAKFYNLDLGL